MRGFCGSLCHGLHVVPTSQFRGMDTNCFHNGIVQSSAAHRQGEPRNLPVCPSLNLRILRRGRRYSEDAIHPLHFLVCQAQERGTLLLSLPGGNSPSIALRHSTAVEIFPPCLLALLLGGRGLVLRVELPVQHGVDFLL